MTADTACSSFLVCMDIATRSMEPDGAHRSVCIGVQILEEYFTNTFASAGMLSP